MENPTKEKFYNPSTVLLHSNKNNDPSAGDFENVSSFEQTDFYKINETIAEGRNAIEDLRRSNYDSLIPEDSEESNE